MDFSKAFDAINHDVLIAKLHWNRFDKGSLKFLLSNNGKLLNSRNKIKINTTFWYLVINIKTCGLKLEIK